MAPWSVERATTMLLGVTSGVVPGGGAGSRLRQATYTVPSAAITGSDGSRACSVGPLASTGSPQVTPPSSETFIKIRRMSWPPEQPPEITRQSQPCT